MLDKLFGGNDRERDANHAATPRDRDVLIRERMQADGITQEEATRLVLSEEELAVGKREVRAGEVEINKDVETRHVRENVPLRHEEVTVERRPITGGMVAGDARIQEEEIHVPLMEEEAIVEKRVVPTEEIVVGKREVVENQTVEADLRRERANVHRERDELRPGVDSDGDGMR